MVSWRKIRTHISKLQGLNKATVCVCVCFPSGLVEPQTDIWQLSKTPGNALKGAWIHSLTVWNILKELWHLSKTSETSSRTPGTSSMTTRASSRTLFRIYASVFMWYPPGPLEHPWKWEIRFVRFKFRKKFFKNYFCSWCFYLTPRVGQSESRSQQKHLSLLRFSDLDH